MRSAILLILGAIITALGVWLILSAGHTPLGIVAALVTAAGGAFLAAGLASLLDALSPTSKKL